MNKTSNMKHLKKGLGFVDTQNPQYGVKAATQAIAKTDRTTGKYVLKDLTASAEVFELLSVSTQGMDSIEIRLRSTYNGAIYTQDNFWKIRPAFPNEAKANARQGSDQFVQYWAANSHQYY